MNSLYQRKRALIASVLAHIFLLVWLLFFDYQKVKEKTKPVNSAKKAIESYLYKMPKPNLVVEKLVPKPELKLPQETRPKKVEKTEKVAKNRNINEKKAVQAGKRSGKLVNYSVNNQPKTALLKAKENFSSYKQLDNLRNAINKQIMMQELAELQQFRSPSIMHGEQIPVQHSNVQLTPEQVRGKNTIKMSDSISITKLDNGLCIIERDQFLGSPIEGSSAAFSCGESKFDKSFREYMKKIQDKYAPIVRTSNK